MIENLKVKKFAGQIMWSDDNTSISHAIIRENSLAIDFTYEGNDYIVMLNRSGHEYSGTYSIKKTRTTSTASCRIFHDDEGNKLLFGKWVEGGLNYSWCAELDEDES
jgi:hypothetical protein